MCYHPQVRLIDFGSACFQSQGVYTYIQPRFYRAPEVLRPARRPGFVKYGLPLPAWRV